MHTEPRKLGNKTSSAPASILKKKKLKKKSENLLHLHILAQEVNPGGSQNFQAQR